jgi:adenylate cyclase
MEGANKTYGTLIMISERTHDLVGSTFLCRELDYLIVKGKTKPIRVFELIGENNVSISDKTRELIEIYNRGLILYRDRQFKKAINEFLQALKLNVDDGPSQLYLIRSQAYLKKPPPKEWNGVFELKTK